MGITTIRPNGTVSNSQPWTAVNAPTTLHGNTSDDSDTSRVDASTSNPGSLATLDLGTFTVSAGTYIRRIRARVRYDTVAGSSGGTSTWFRVDLDVSSYTEGDFYSSLEAAIVTKTGAWFNTGPQGQAWSQSILDALRLQIYALGNTYHVPRIRELYVDVETNSLPVGTVTAPAEASTITTTSQPTTTWTYSDADLDTQTKYQVKIFSAAQYGAGGFNPETSTATYDSGVLSGTALTHKATASLPNATYRSYVKVAQTVDGADQWSAWDFNQYTLTITPPATPVITATAQLTPVPRVQLSITYGAGTDFLEVEYSDNAGATWSTLRGASRYVVDGTSPDVLYDYESKPGLQRSYRARAIDKPADEEFASAYSSTVTATVTFDPWWIKDLTDPLNYSMAVDVMNIPFTQTRQEERAEFHALSRANPVVVRGILRGEEFPDITFEFTAEADWAKFESIRNLQRTLLLQRGWTGEQWYISLGSQRSLALQNTFPVMRTVTMSAVEVDKP